MATTRGQAMEHMQDDFSAIGSLEGAKLAYQRNMLHSFPYVRRELTAHALITQSTVKALCVRADGAVWLIAVGPRGAWRKVKAYGSL